MKKRINYIDIARGFAIIFIALGHTVVHSQHCGLLCKLLYSFHVILFFIISGYLFRVKDDEKFITFFINKTKRILIPYFAWALIFLIPYILLGKSVGNSLGTKSSFDIITQLKNTLYGIGRNSAIKQHSSLWFLPALFSMQIVYYFVIKTVKDKSNKIKILTVIPILMLAYIFNYTKIILPFGINSAIILGIGFYFGWLCKELSLFDKTKLFKLRYIILMLIVGLICAAINRDVSCINYEYGYLTFAYISGMCLSIVTIYISYIIGTNKCLEYIGKNTMGILIFHKIVIILFQTKMGPISRIIADSNFVGELSLSIVAVILSFVLSLILTEITRKLLPILIGEKKD